MQLLIDPSERFDCFVSICFEMNTRNEERRIIGVLSISFHSFRPSPTFIRNQLTLQTCNVFKITTDSDEHRRKAEKLHGRYQTVHYVRESFIILLLILSPKAFCLASQYPIQCSMFQLASGRENTQFFLREHAYWFTGCLHQLSNFQQFCYLKYNNHSPIDGFFVPFDL